MDKFVAFSNKTEGRDKFCKVVQYGCRMLKALTANQAVIERLNSIFVACRDSRKMFRLWKFVHEFQSITSALGNISMDMPEMILHILSRSSFFVYWLFDNLNFLSSIKFLKFDPAPLAKRAGTAWFFGVLLSIINVLRSLSMNYARETKIRNAADPGLQTTKQSLDLLKKKRKDFFINLVKNLGDLLPSSAIAGVPERLFKKKIPEVWIGLGGLVSGSIAAYQAWP